jgi:hypothetical protein
MDDRDTTLRRYRSYSTNDLSNIAQGVGAYPHEAGLAQQVLDERAAGHPYFLRDVDHLNELPAGPYPERFGTMTAVMLDEETRKTIRCELSYGIDRNTKYMDESNEKPTGYAAYWAAQLWAIDRACRALGIEG